MRRKKQEEKSAFYIFAKEDMKMIVTKRHEEQEPREGFAK